jgi:uncharacterized membrane protein
MKRKPSAYEQLAQANRDVLRAYMDVAAKSISPRERAERRKNADWLARDLARESIAVTRVKP